MENFKKASEEGQKIILDFLKKRMKEKKITQIDLSTKLEISLSTTQRYLANETDMPFRVYLEVCGILELRPYLIPSEIDQNEMQRIFFN